MFCIPFFCFVVVVVVVVVVDDDVSVFVVVDVVAVVLLLFVFKRAFLTFVCFNSLVCDSLCVLLSL